MKNSKSIQVFEYEHLFYKEHGFTKSHWEALGWYNEKQGGRFFSLTPKGVKFNQYVGVIQVGNLTIEILPKISRVGEKENKGEWQKVLIDMLQECRWMRVYAHEKAVLRFKANSILEAYLELFLQECEELVRQGLVKKYRAIDKNCSALKGKLLFQKQIQVNLVHKEKFYTSHQVYDLENIYNQILLKAAKLIPILSQSPFLKDRVYNLILSYPELEDISVNQSTFQNLVYDRKTIRYKEAIEIAAMLLLNYRPDISSGQNHILAILFDMNNLWEEYVYRQIIRNNIHGWLIVPQEYQTVWKKDNSNTSKGVKPDIVIKGGGKKLIIDTKWKLPEDDDPDDADLKQMFMYNEYWEGANAVLLYPKERNMRNGNEIKYTPGQFIWGKQKPLPQIGYRHECGVMKACVLDGGNNLDIRFGEFLNEKLNVILK